MNVFNHVEWIIHLSWWRHQMKTFPRYWPLCGEFTGHRWIPLTKCQCRGALMFSLICVWINGWVNNRKAGDLRRHPAHYGTTVMFFPVRLPPEIVYRGDLKKHIYFRPDGKETLPCEAKGTPSPRYVSLTCAPRSSIVLQFFLHVDTRPISPFIFFFNSTFYLCIIIVIFLPDVFDTLTEVVGNRTSHFLC